MSQRLRLQHYKKDWRRKKMGKNMELVKKEAHIEKLKASLTKTEIARIEEVRQFEALNKGTAGYKVAVENDQVRRSVTKAIRDIQQELWTIENQKNSILRHQTEVTSGVINSELKPGVPLTVDELKTQIKYEEWQNEGTAKDICIALGTLRSFVGHKDVIGKVVLDEGGYDGMVNDIEKSLAQLGFELFTVEAS